MGGERSGVNIEDVEDVLLEALTQAVFQAFKVDISMGKRFNSVTKRKKPQKGTRNTLWWVRNLGFMYRYVLMLDTRCITSDYRC